MALPGDTARMPTTSICGAESVTRRATWCTAVNAAAPAIPDSIASFVVSAEVNMP
jgi:hypothetical protein